MKFDEKTVLELIENDILYPPMDGNHGSIHPKGNDFVEEGIPFIMASDIQNGIINFETCKYITVEQAETLKKGFAKVGDVLLTHKATIGRTAIVPETKYPYIMLSPQVTYYRVKNKSILNPAYLEMYFKSYYFQSVLKNWAGSGSTRAYLGILAQRKLPIRMILIKMQQQIVDSILPIELKIDNNEQLISNLKELAQTLFKRWFVDFEFPNDEGKPYKSSGGKMIESELGMIPEGWSVGTFSDIAKVVMGQSPKSSTYNEEQIGIPLINGASDFKKDKIEPLKHTTDPKRLSQKGDYLFGVRATVGNVTYVDGEYALGRGVGVARVKDKKYGEYSYFHLINGINRLKYGATGSVYINFTRNDLTNMKLVMSSREIIEMFHENTLSIFEEKHNLLKQNKALEILRDTLLPKLLSGEIELPDNMEVTDDVQIS